MAWRGVTGARNGWEGPGQQPPTATPPCASAPIALSPPPESGTPVLAHLAQCRDTSRPPLGSRGAKNGSAGEGGEGGGDAAGGLAAGLGWAGQVLGWAGCWESRAPAACRSESQVASRQTCQTRVAHAVRSRSAGSQPGRSPAPPPRRRHLENARLPALRLFQPCQPVFVPHFNAGHLQVDLLKVHVPSGPQALHDLAQPCGAAPAPGAAGGWVGQRGPCAEARPMMLTGCAAPPAAAAEKPGRVAARRRRRTGSRQQQTRERRTWLD